MQTHPAKLTVKQFKQLIRDGRLIDCVENTFKPELNGTERKIVKAQGNGYFYTVRDDGKRYWTGMPSAKEIVRSHTDGFGGVYVTLQLPPMFGPTATVTLKFYLEETEQFT